MLCPYPGRILVRGVNWLGDAVMTTPALLRLRETYPNAAIALLTPAKLADLWTSHTAVNEVLTFEPAESAISIARRVRAKNFQVGLVLPNSFRSAFELWLARIPTRLGYAGQMRSRLLTKPVGHRAGVAPMHKRSKHEIHRLIHRSPAPGLKGHTPSALGITRNAPALIVPLPEAALEVHHIHQYLHLVSQLGANAAPIAPRLFVNEAETSSFLRRFQVEFDSARPLFGLNPGAEYGPAKRWPAECFIAAAREVRKKTDCTWLIFGGPRDLDLANQVAAQIDAVNPPLAGKTANQKPVLNLAGKTSLRDLCVALKLCQAVLTNDTGPMHLAAAVGTPVIVPFGSTSPALTGPGLPGDSRHRLLVSGAPCSPCFLRQCPIDFRCMRDIPVSEVVSAVLSYSRAFGGDSSRPS